MADQTITANRLRDGAVVWRTAEGGWTETVAQAVVLGDDAIEAAVTAAQADETVNQIVVAVYAVEVEATAQGPVPTRLRERIRAEGPTVRGDLGRSAA